MDYKELDLQRELARLEMDFEIVRAFRNGAPPIFFLVVLGFLIDDWREKGQAIGMLYEMIFAAFCFACVFYMLLAFGVRAHRRKIAKLKRKGAYPVHNANEPYPYLPEIKQEIVESLEGGEKFTRMMMYPVLVIPVVFIVVGIVMGMFGMLIGGIVLGVALYHWLGHYTMRSFQDRINYFQEMSTHENNKGR